MLNPRILVTGALLLIALVVATYCLKVGMVNPLSDQTATWGAFGDYLGGVAGTLLSFVSILLLVYTIHEQNHHELKRDLLAHVAAADARIEHWLLRRLPIVSLDNETVEFGDVVWGLFDYTKIRAETFPTAMERLLVLTAPYCEAIGVYSDNINSNHLLQHHQKKAESLLTFLESHLQSLGHMAGPGIALCRKVLYIADED